MKIAVAFIDSQHTDNKYIYSDLKYAIKAAISTSREYGYSVLYLEENTIPYIEIYFKDGMPL